MLQFIQEYYVEVMCTILTATVIGFIKYAVKIVKGIVTSTLAIGHDKLYRFSEFYILTNQITLDELKNLEHIYEGYHALGGNGTGTELFERCKELPIVEKRTRHNPYYIYQEEKE